MSQPTASVDIANLALDALGQDSVVSIVSPQQPAAYVLARHYDQVRRLLLRKYIFNFSRKVVLLTPSSNAPTHPEFINGYAYPTDLVRLLKLGDRILYAGAVPTKLYDFSAGFLYCDQLVGPVGVASPAPVLQVSGLYPSGSLYAGVTVPYGSTVIAVEGGTPIPGAQYQLSGLVGSVQANGNVYQITAGTLGPNSVYFLQTAGGVNFDSTNWGPYQGGGAADPIYVPPGMANTPTGLEMTYTYDAQNVLQFDSAFIDVVALTLAVRCCKQLTKKNPSQDLIAELRNAEVAAAAISGQEKPPVRVERSLSRDVRRAGGLWNNNTRIGGA